MKTIEDIQEWIEDEIYKHEQNISQMKELEVDRSAYGYGVADGALETLYYLKEFIEEA